MKNKIQHRTPSKLALKASKIYSDLKNDKNFQSKSIYGKMLLDKEKNYWLIVFPIFSYLLYKFSRVWM